MTGAATRRWAALIVVAGAIFAQIGAVGAQADADASDDSSTDAPLAVVRGPGGRGYWLVDEDGSVEIVGTEVQPLLLDMAELEVRVESVRPGAPGAMGLWLLLADGEEVPVGDPGPNVRDPTRRPVGWLSGVGVRQLLSGNWWPDIDRACVAELPRGVRIGQLVMVTLSEREFGLAVEEARDHLIGGILLIGGASEFIDRRIAEVQDFAGLIPLLFAVDEEGGTVQRLRGLLPRLASAVDQADDRPDVVSNRYLLHGESMSDIGFDMNFAPVLDVGAGPGIGSRSFGDDPDLVTSLGLAVVEGLSSAGVTPVVKHFPGHGSASADSHRELPSTAPLPELRARDLLPFVAAIEDGRAAIMVGHLDVPGLTGGVPASLSSAAIDGLLRDELGFEGLVVTDALDMAAVADRWTTPQAVELAIAAGADLALVDGLDDVGPVFDQIDDAVVNGRLGTERLDDAVTNVLRAKGINGCTLVGRVRSTLNTIRDF